MNPTESLITTTRTIMPSHRPYQALKLSSLSLWTICIRYKNVLVVFLLFMNRFLFVYVCCSYSYSS